MKDNHFSELLKGSSIVFLLKIFGILLSYIFIYIVSIFFGAKGVGIFALSFTLLQILSIIGRFGVDTSIVKLFSETIMKDKDKILSIYKTSFFLVLSISSFLTVSLFLLAPFLAEFVFKKPYLTLPFQVISFAIFPLSIRFVNAEALKSLKAIIQYSLLQYVLVFLFGILILILFILIYNEKNSLAPVLVLILSMILTTFFSFFFLVKEIKKISNIKISYFFDKRNIFPFREILKISIPLFFASSFSFLIAWTDTIILGIFRTDEEVGIYNIAIKIVFVIMFPLTAISTVLMPKIATLWEIGDKENIKALNRKAILIIGFVNLFPLAIFLLLPEKALSIFGKEFIEGGTALSILAIGYFINSIFSVLEYTLQMTIYQKFYSKLIVFIFIVNLILNYILIPLYGVNGAALATTLSLILWKLLVLSFYIRKVIK